METGKQYEVNLESRSTLPTEEMYQFIDKHTKGRKFSKKHQDILNTPNRVHAYQIKSKKSLQSLERHGLYH